MIRKTIETWGKGNRAMINWKKALDVVESHTPDEDEMDKDLVLVVDDEATNRKMLERALTAHYKVMTAASGREALEILNQPDVAVIITDQRMPGMSGIQLCQEAERRNHPAIRLILTGFAELSNVIDAIKGGDGLDP